MGEIRGDRSEHPATNLAAQRHRGRQGQFVGHRQAKARLLAWDYLHQYRSVARHNAEVRDRGDDFAIALDPPV